MDALTGNIQFDARPYNPADARWLRPDPLGFTAGDTNLYRYTFNNSINHRDPSGLDLGILKSDPYLPKIRKLEKSLRAWEIYAKELQHQIDVLDITVGIESTNAENGQLLLAG